MKDDTISICCIFVAVVVLVSLVLMIMYAYSPKTNSVDDKVSVYVDEDTGVNYLVYDGVDGGGMVVRYDADGSIMVREGEDK